MRAIRIHEYGGPDVVRREDVPVPEPGEGEILVKVAAAAVNPVDWEIRNGMLKDLLKSEFPLTLGCDVSGTVEKLGPGVNGFGEGDAVYAFLDLHRCGAFADFAIVKHDEAGRKPERLDFVHAAALPVAVLTAWQAIFDTAQLESGQTILVHAGAGGVGSMAVQLAKWKGARVIATASESNREYVLALGAAEVIDYKKVKFESVVKKVDVVLDTLGGETQERSFQVLKPGGFLVSLISPPSEQLAKEHQARVAMIGVKTNGKRLSEAAKLADDSVIKPLVEFTYPMDDVGRALEKSESGRVRGKIVLTA